jgi:hypothetical protein
VGPAVLTLVKPVPDHDIVPMTMGTHFRTGKHHLAKTLDVLVDKASKFGYNDHALQPDSKDAIKLTPSSRAVPNSVRKGTRLSFEKRQSAIRGLPTTVFLSAHALAICFVGQLSQTRRLLPLAQGAARLVRALL